MTTESTPSTPELELTIQEEEERERDETNRLTFEECEEFFDEKKDDLELVEIVSPEIKILINPDPSFSLSIFNCLYSLFFNKS